MSDLVRHNLAVLYRVWRLGQSGQLRMISVDRRDPVSQLLPIAQGGLMDKGMWPIFLEKLDTHVFSLEERPSDVQGNRKLMSALILSACRRNHVNQRDLVLTDEASTPERGSTPLLNLMPAITLPPFLDLPQASDVLEDPLQDQLLRQGRDLLARGRFEEADAVLSAARDLRMDHAPTLACLARARASNPTRSVADRARDAEAMVKLAWLLAPDDQDVMQAHDAVLGAAPRIIDSRRSEANGR